MGRKTWPIGMILMMALSGCASRCVVTENIVDERAAKLNPELRTTYKGREFLFCSPGCKPLFEANPVTYLDARRDRNLSRGGHSH